MKQRGGHTVGVLGSTMVALVLMTSCSSPKPPDVPTSSTPAPARPDSDVEPVSADSIQDFNCARPTWSGAKITDLTNGPAASGLVAIVLDEDVHAWGDTGARYEGFHFQKVWIALKTGAKMEILVPPAMQDSMRIGWSNDGYRLANELKVPGCESNPPGAQWVAYPGGFWLKEAGCVPLTITTDTATETIHVPIGRKCT